MTSWLSLCRDRACIACGRNDGTTVPAHANQQAFGKGMGIKAADWSCVPLCASCHSWLDAGPADREAKKAAWLQWWTVHMFGLLQAELVAPVGAVAKDKGYKRPSKILPRSA